MFLLLWLFNIKKLNSAIFHAICGYHKFSPERAVKTLRHSFHENKLMMWNKNCQIAFSTED